MFSMIDIGLAIVFILIVVTWFCFVYAKPPSQTLPSKTDENHDGQEPPNQDVTKEMVCKGGK